MFPIFAGNSASTGYNLTRSLRLRNSASAYLSRTPTSNGSRQIFTWSGWVKRGTLGSSLRSGLFNSGDTNSPLNGIQLIFFNDTLNVGATGNSTLNLASSAVYRDVSSWYHIVLAVDTTQATSTNRAKLYVNGLQITALSATTYPAQNQNFDINNTSYAMKIGASLDTGATVYYLDGYLTEVNFIDGQALTPSSFGSTNALTGVWQPARYTGTYGTNGFYLPFTDNSALTTASNVGLGKDFSGNGNYWTTNNISITAGATYDSMTDVPTLTSATASNFCVLNPVDKDSDITMSNGNLTATAATGVHNNARSTMGCGTTGYWYMEFTYTSSISGGNAIAVGLYDPAFRIDNGTHPVTSGSGFYGLYGSVTSNMYTNGTTPSVTVSTGSVGNILQFAYDVAGGKLWYGLNNVWYDSSGGTTGNPSTGSNATITTVATNRIFGLDIVSNTINFNFGQQPFTYTPPTGFVALNTYNIPTSTIVKGNTVMDATLYTGTGASQAVTNAGAFKPDFAWLKIRSGAANHILIDSVRGVTNYLNSNTTNAEASSADQFLSFNSNGFTVGANTTGGNTNQSGSTYVGWQWQAGQGSSSSNTNGTITSTVSVNASAGFSVVTFAASVALSPQTVGHGLGVAPSLIFVKSRSSSAGGWYTYHSAIGATQLLQLNLTSAQQTTSGPWNNTAPTSSVFTLGGSYFPDATSTTYVAYCWTPIAGFSAFGSYTGNGSTDGPMIYTGFRPKFVMVKCSSSDLSGAAHWAIEDSSRSTYNAADAILYANLSNAEGSGEPVDFLSNGFKIRNTVARWNSSGATFIYMAFAESPFRNSLAR